MALNIYNFKNLKRVRGIVRFPLVSSSGGGMLDFLGGGMLGISILGVFVFIVISTFFLLFLNPSITSGGEPISAPPPPPPSTDGTAITVVPTCANVDQLLLSYFGVKIKPVTESVSCEVRKKIFKIYTIPTQSSHYRELLKPSKPFTIEFYSGTYGKASGKVPSADLMRLTGFASFVSNDSFFRYASFLLIHETGHVMRARNSWIANEYPNNSLTSSDPGCYEFGYLKTYSRPGGTTPLSENMAEASGLYVYNSKTGKYATISNFRTQCDATYNWTKNKIFGGIIIKP